MKANDAVLALLLSAACAAPARAGGFVPFTPESRYFSCEIPADWQVFEEKEASGFAVHVVGPDNPAGTYRAGIDIHWIEDGKPGFTPVKKMLNLLRRSDKGTKRDSSPARRLVTGSGLARFLEVGETRRLPPDQMPSREEKIHHYVAVIQNGESYYLIDLATTEDVYLDYREQFMHLLKSFTISNY